MHEAERMLKTLPVSRRVICRAHEVLLDSVRGAGKSPGEYRRVPNWIGPPGCGVEERAQAEENLTKARGILGLYDDLKTSIPRMTRSRYATPALDWLFRRPVFSSTDFVRSADIPEPTARRFLAVLRTNGVLKELVPSAGRRAALWVFPDLLTYCSNK